MVNSRTIQKSTTAVSSQTWFVATEGADVNDGTIVSPFATLEQGLRVAQAGDRILMSPGTYLSTEFSTAAIGRDRIGFRDLPVTVEPLDGASDSVILSCATQHSSGWIADGGLWWKPYTGNPQEVFLGRERLQQVGARSIKSNLSSGDLNYLPPVGVDQNNPEEADNHPVGWYYADGTSLWIKLTDGVSPNGRDVQVAEKRWFGRFPSGVVLKKLNFHYASEDLPAGGQRPIVHLQHDSVVDSCSFLGGNHGQLEISGFHCHVLNSRFEHAGAVGIMGSAGGHYEPFVSTYDAGAFSQGSIQNCYFTKINTKNYKPGNLSGAIKLIPGTTGVLIANNTLHDVGYAFGIWLDEVGHSNIITGNHITGVCGTAIFAPEVSGDIGIWRGGHKTVIISNNFIEGSEILSGIRISAACYAVVAYNTVLDTHWGIYINHDDRKPASNCGHFIGYNVIRGRATNMVRPDLGNIGPRFALRLNDSVEYNHRNTVVGNRFLQTSNNTGAWFQWNLRQNGVVIDTVEAFTPASFNTALETKGTNVNNHSNLIEPAEALVETEAFGSDYISSTIANPPNA